MTTINLDLLLKLRLAVARFGEMDGAKWWNTTGQFGPLRLGAAALRRGFPRTHRFAQAADRSVSDIDTMIIRDDLTYGDVFGALKRVAKIVGRQVNPTVYSAAEFSKRTHEQNAFAARVLEQPKVWIIGSEHDLRFAA